MSQSPFTFAEARRAMHDASQRQIDAENELRLAQQASFEARRVYRSAKSVRIIELHDEGVAWSVCEQLASGSPAVTEAKYAFDIAEGRVEVCKQMLYRLAADRRSTLALCEWSMRRELAEGGAS